MKLDMQSIMQQAQKVQQDMEKVKNELSRKTVRAESGGGMVQVEITGDNRIVSLKIAKEAVDPNEVEMLEDLVVAAANKAIADAADMARDEMRKATGNMPNIPGLNLGL